jgi:hypothetical protein
MTFGESMGYGSIVLGLGHFTYALVDRPNGAMLMTAAALYWIAAAIFLHR